MHYFSHILRIEMSDFVSAVTLHWYLVFHVYIHTYITFVSDICSVHPYSDTKVIKSSQLEVFCDVPSTSTSDQFSLKGMFYLSQLRY